MIKCSCVHEVIDYRSDQLFAKKVVVHCQPRTVKCKGCVRNGPIKKFGMIIRI